MKSRAEMFGLIQVLNSFASEHFICLTNLGDRWEIKYRSFDGESICSMENSTLDELVADWVDLEDDLTVDDGC